MDGRVLFAQVDGCCDRAQNGVCPCEPRVSSTGGLMDVRLRDGQQESIDPASAAHLILTNAQYIHWYDALPSGEPDELSPLDLAYPAFLDAVPNFKALLAVKGWENLRTALAAASDVLRRVPADLDLVDWPATDDNRALLVDLFRATTGGENHRLSGFGPARCTKMLHKKRPALIPIIDSWQLQAWHMSALSWSTTDMAEVVFSIRGMIAPQLNELRKLSNELRRIEPSLPRLSALRLYDILFWELSRQLPE